MNYSQYHFPLMLAPLQYAVSSLADVHTWPHTHPPPRPPLGIWFMLQGRMIRYYGTPDSPEAWKLFFDIKTDLVNTDNLMGLRSFIFDAMNSPEIVSDLSLAAGSPDTPATNTCAHEPLNGSA